jgi:molybdopterin molybdotransferase
MPEFLSLVPPDNARDTLLKHIEYSPGISQIPVFEALDRVLAMDIVSNENLPAFVRSTVDGYAVRCVDTFGSTETMPSFFSIIGEVRMGEKTDLTLSEGQCAVIHTGGMLPQGADAVVMIEHTQKSIANEIEVFRAIGKGENILHQGEDVEIGERIFSKGNVIQIGDIGGLLALGFVSIPVFNLPKVGIISTGDELVEPGDTLLPGKIRDINSYTLSNLIRKYGGIPKTYGIVRDNPDSLARMMRQAHMENDLVIVTAGSSASVRDYTSDVVNLLGSPGVLVHGVNVRPGKPTILGYCDHKPVIGLPGNPVSALVIAMLFVLPVLRKLRGEVQVEPLVDQRVRVSINVSSVTGREDWVPVKFLSPGRDGILVVEPIFYKSNLIFSVIRADGFVKIGSDANGIMPNDILDFYRI